MKTIILLSIALLASTVSFAQKNSTTSTHRDSSAKPVIELSAPGDNHLKKEIQKNQLKKAPELLGKPAAAGAKQKTSSVGRKQKNCKHL